MSSQRLIAREKAAARIRDRAVQAIHDAYKCLEAIMTIEDDIMFETTSGQADADAMTLLEVIDRYPDLADLQRSQVTQVTLDSIMASPTLSATSSSDSFMSVSTTSSTDSQQDWDIIALLVAGAPVGDANPVVICPPGPRLVAQIFEQCVRIVQMYSEMYDRILRERVLHRYPPAPKSSQLDRLWHFHFHKNIPEFKRLVRVQPAVFDQLVALIRDHPVFHNNSPHAQIDPKIQLAIFLYRMGHYGNAAGIREIGDWSGVSSGTVTNCTRRVAIALLDLHDLALAPPSDAERASARSYVVSRTECQAWKGGILAVDGTAIKLFKAPPFCAEAFYNKNSDYAVALQVVVLVDSLLFVDYAVGQVGSAHDARAFKDTQIYDDRDAFLDTGDFVLADAAYALAPWCITPFKHPPHGRLPREKRTFNYVHSRIRVQIECAIGLLKGLWQSLIEMRILIKDREALAWAVIWIRCALILHSLNLKIEEVLGISNRSDYTQMATEGGWNPTAAADAEDDDDVQMIVDDDIGLEAQDAGGVAFRQYLMESILGTR